MSSEDLHSLKFGDERSAKKIRVASPMSSCFCSALHLLHSPEENDLLKNIAGSLYLPHFKSLAAAKSHISQSRPYPPPQPLPLRLSSLPHSGQQGRSPSPQSLSFFMPAWLLPMLGERHFHSALLQPLLRGCSFTEGFPQGIDCCFYLNPVLSST